LEALKWIFKIYMLKKTWQRILKRVAICNVVSWSHNCSELVNWKIKIKNLRIDDGETSWIYTLIAKYKMIMIHN